MDSLTQIVLGASVAEACLGKKVGNRAPFWGAILGTLPDLDVLGRLFQTEYEATLTHRGASHSLLFCLVVAPLAGWLIYRLYKGNWGTRRQWTMLSFWVFATHILLDCFTAWGTQVFWPISNYRVAFNNISVADPAYTLPFLLCVLVVLFIKRNNPKRQFWNYTGLTISSLYMLLTLVNKASVDRIVAHQLHEEGISTVRFSTYPVILNNILWTVVVEGPTKYHIGYYSLLDDQAHIDFRPLDKARKPDMSPKDQAFIDGMAWLTNGYYRMQKKDSTWYWEDLRYGLDNFDPHKPAGPIFSYQLVQEGNTFTDIHMADRPINNGDEFQKAFGELWARMLGK